jgi:hypothetical protein
LSKSKFLLSALVAVSIIAAASPANAAQSRALPEESIMYALDGASPGGGLASIDVTTALATRIGSNVFPQNQDVSWGGAYDTVTDTIYVSWYKRIDSFSSKKQLFSVDHETGESTLIGDLTSTLGLNDMMGLMAGPDGIVYAVYGAGGVSVTNYVGEVNTATGVITEIAPLAPNMRGSTFFRGASYNPADGKYYGVNGVGLYEINVTDGAVISQGDNGDNSTWGNLAFDSNGVMYGSVESKLASSTISGWATPGVQELSTQNITDGSSTFNAVDFVIVPRATLPTDEDSASTDEVAALAATGVNSGSLGTLAAGALLLALFGTAFALLARRSKTAR